METGSKKISVSQLRPGMYIEDVFNENELLLFSADTLVSGYHEIESLKKQGVSYLFVNVKKSKGQSVESLNPPKDSAFPELPKKNVDTSGFPELSKVVIEDLSAGPDVLRSYEKQLKQAFNVRQKTVYTVRNMLSDIRAGRAFSMQTVINTVEEMVEEILENNDVSLRICQLKKHSYNTYVHSVNVSVLMAAFAASLGYSKEKIIEISIGGMLHDIGKVKVPEHLLRKSGAYTMHELEQIKKHPLSGVEILKKMSLKVPDTTYNIILQHHERYNGGGYPQRLKGKQIDEMAQICAIADVYDTLTSETNHRKSCLPQEALALIFQGSDEEYSRTLVEYFTKMLGIYPVGSFVKLISQEMGIVVKINRNSLLAPHVMILFDTQGNRLSAPYIRNLMLDGERVGNKIECSLNPESFQVNTDQFITSL
jgi:putative nucleotidyltransferase with HDIG domain